jgi:DNA-binding beta-propeller fold protein YncE
VRHTGHNAKAASTSKAASPRIGIFAAPHAFSGARGSGAGGWALNPNRARGPILAALVSVCALLCVLLFGSVTAQAYLTHPYLSQLTGFGNPAAVTVGPGGDLYVADSSSGGAGRAGLAVIDRFSSSGTPLSFSASESYVKGSQLTGTPSGPFASPQGVAVNNSTGEIYVSDGGKKVVDVFKASGEYLSQFTKTTPGGTLNEPDGLTFDQSTSELYVTDPGNSVVDVFSSSGGYLFQFGPPFHKYESVAVDDLTGDAYVAESNAGLVDVFDSLGGSVAQEWAGGGTLAGSFGSGAGYTYVGLDQASGHVYVAQSSQGVVDEFEASAEERFVAQVTGADTPAGGFGHAEAVAVDPSSGDLYVADGGSGVVDVFGPLAVQPDVSTGTASSVGTTTATLEGVVDPDETSVTGCEFEYRTEAEASFAHTIACAPALPLTGKEPVAVSANVTGLQVNTTYYYRLAATNANGTNYGSAQSLLTSGPLAIDAESVSGVRSTHVTLNAGINPDGIATHYHFEYGPSAVYSTSIPIPEGEIPAGFGEQAVSINVTGLKPNTTYHFRIVASSECEPVQHPGHICTVDDPDEVFTTLPAVLIESESVSDVAATTATLEAQLDPLGASATCVFEYVTDASFHSTGYQAAVTVPCPAALGEGEVGVPASVHLQSFTADTIYHYRVIATSSLGTSVVGEDHTFTTQRSGESPTLLDGREWELVSPPDKYGATLEGFAPGGAAIQASEDGGAITYAASSPTEANPPGDQSPERVQVFSTRGGGGAGGSSSWSSRDIATPHDAPTLEVQTGHESEYKLFSGDLSFGLVEAVGETPLCPHAAEGECPGAPPYLRDDAGGTYTPLVYPGNVPGGTDLGRQSGRQRPVTFVGATPDFSHVVLESIVPLLAGGSGGLYEWSAGKPPSEQLQQLGVLPKSEGGAVVGAGDPSPRFHELSDDGSVFFGSGGHLYLQDVAKDDSFRLDVAQGVVEPAGADASFLYASSDGSRVLFRDSEQLTEAGGGGIYECRIAEGAAGPTCAGLQLTDLIIEGGLLGASEDGSYLYFVSGGVLAGSGATSPGNNLYVDHYNGSSWTPTFVTQLAGDDSQDWSPPELDRLTSRVSPDGRWLAFMSNSSLTGYDNRDALSGQPDEEVYLYDAEANRLVCASCDPTGARPTGIFDNGTQPFPLVDTAKVQSGRWLAGLIPGWTPSGANGSSDYQSRYLSDGGRLFFESSDALVPQDTNGTEDVYEYEPAAGPGGGPGGSELSSAQAPPNDGCAAGSSTYSARSEGCIGLISSGSSGEESAFLDASENGADVFFLTASKLVPQDAETSLSLYDAHVCGAEGVPCPPPPPATPPACTNSDSCRAAPSPQPAIFSPPPSATFSGVGNITPEVAPPPKKVTKKTVKCKGKTRNKKGQCVKKKTKKRAKRASRDRRTKA